MSKLSEKVKELRIEQGLTVKELAAKANLSVPVVSGVEKDTLKPTDLTIGKLAKALNYNFKDLLDLREN